MAKENDRLGEILKSTAHHRLDAALKGKGEVRLRADLERRPVKDTSLMIRLTSADKASIRQTAKSLKLSAADYLVSIHRLVAERLR
jgi:hypothetical protein